MEDFARAHKADLTRIEKKASTSLESIIAEYRQQIDDFLQQKIEKYKREG